MPGAQLLRLRVRLRCATTRRAARPTDGRSLARCCGGMTAPAASGAAPSPPGGGRHGRSRCRLAAYTANFGPKVGGGGGTERRPCRATAAAASVAGRQTEQRWQPATVKRASGGRQCLRHSSQGQRTGETARQNQHRLAQRDSYSSSSSSNGRGINDKVLPLRFVAISSKVRLFVIIIIIIIYLVRRHGP